MAALSLWRIAAETRGYAAHDLSGGGAAKYRDAGMRRASTSFTAADSIALAVLETAAHIDSGGLPMNRFLVEIRVPMKVWKARQQIDSARIGVAWSAVPAGKASVDIGSNWYRSSRSALLIVPSVIVPEAGVVLINATHAEARLISARTVRPFDYDKVFRG